MGWIGLLSPYLPAVFISPPDPHADEIPTFLNSDQILVVTSGVGIVANESKEQEITVGGVVHIRKGENHWHGARAESYMSHITITAV